MENRKVNIDFSNAEVHWNPAQPEYSQTLNAISTHIPYLEPFLIKVVRDAQRELPTSEVGLHRDIDMFVAQESRHYRMHERFNKTLRQTGYDRLPAFESRIRSDFEHFYNNKGLKFSLAYCEGFETCGPIMAGFFFNKGAELMKDWHEPTVYLWLWHFAEEYEHRTVCYDLYHRLYGGYWYRIFVLWYTVLHLFGYSGKVTKYLLSEDRKAGRINNVGRSMIRHLIVKTRMTLYVVPRLIWAMRPGYDPAKIPAPERVHAFLEEASKRFGVVG